LVEDYNFRPERSNRFVAKGDNRKSPEEKNRREISSSPPRIHESQLFYQPQTPVMAMIKAKRTIAEAVNHFLIVMIFSF
jgi:hypothetical protein